MADTTEVRIPPVEAKRRVDAGQALLLDVVQPHVWAGLSQAIRGAVRISPEEVGERAAELRGARGVIAYCT
jgi:rhodanese-related sulfurtransferase